MTKQNRANSEPFSCEKCQFYCIKRSNYNAHLLTKKHKQHAHLSRDDTMELSGDNMRNTKRQVVTQIMAQKVQQPQILRQMLFRCEKCNHTYKDRSGLWRHRKKCVSENAVVDDDEEMELSVARENSVGMTSTNENATSIMLNMIYDLAKQNQEIKELLLKQNEHLMETASRPVVIQQQIINNHTTNNHAHIGVNLFLQEKCKSAVNLTEFVDNLKVEMVDLEMVGRLGFVEGISRIILNELNRLDIYTRPIHCTDTKREVIYVRESNEWTRDTDTNEYTKRAIARVANKNLNKIPEWRRMHPETDIFESPAYEMNMQIMVQSLGGVGGTTSDKTARNQEKIIKRIIPAVVMDKKTVGLLSS